jgi:hypothetical protein
MNVTEMYGCMCASARVCLTYTSSIPHITPVDIYTGHHYRIIYSQVFICLGLISLALYPHNVNKFVLIVSYLYVAIVLSQQVGAGRKAAPQGPRSYAKNMKRAMHGRASVRLRSSPPACACVLCCAACSTARGTFFCFLLAPPATVPWPQALHG